MTLATTRSGALRGIEGLPVDVEADIGSGLPAFNIVGLPDASVQEARERVRAAIRNTGFEFPLRRITVNLAPADVRKEGPLYDLSIAAAVLVASGQITDRFTDTALFGELSLDGRLRHIPGVLPFVAMCAQKGIGSVVVPMEDVAEARSVAGVRVHGLDSLRRIAEPFESWPDAPVVSTPSGRSTNWPALPMPPAQQWCCGCCRSGPDPTPPRSSAPARLKGWLDHARPPMSTSLSSTTN